MWHQNFRVKKFSELDCRKAKKTEISTREALSKVVSCMVSSGGKFGTERVETRLRPICLFFIFLPFTYSYVLTFLKTSRFSSTSLKFLSHSTSANLTLHFDWALSWIFWIFLVSVAPPFFRTSEGEGVPRMIRAFSGFFN